MPRIVTGKYRGAILAAPKGDATRPTTDKVKEALFSMIQTQIPGSNFLDLFAGSGQNGLEALSRGAESVVLVEKAGQAVACIKQNIEKIRATDENITLMKRNVIVALDELEAEINDGKREPFDIIFMDPPYKDAEKYAMQVADKIVASNLLSKDGIVIVEHASDTNFNTDVINLQPLRSCSYGLCVLTFFCNK